MDEKVKILMSETSCSEGEALIALSSAKDNLDDAKNWLIDNNGDIALVKFNFKTSDNIFGAGFFIINKTSLTLLRHGFLVTYNREVMHISLKSAWNVFERKIYRFRLWEGCLQDMTQKLEHRFLLDYTRVEKNAMKNGNSDAIKGALSEMIHSELKIPEPQMQVETEDLISRDYDFSRNKKIPSQEYLFPDLNALVNLLAEIYVEPGHQLPVVFAEDGDVILVRITDRRDIGVYLAKILGARTMEDELKPIPVRCEKIERKGDNIRLLLRYAPGIISIIHIPETSMLTILAMKKNRLARKIKSAFFRFSKFISR